MFTLHLLFYIVSEWRKRYLGLCHTWRTSNTLLHPLQCKVPRGPPHRSNKLTVATYTGGKIQSPTLWKRIALSFAGVTYTTRSTFVLISRTDAEASSQPSRTKLKNESFVSCIHISIWRWSGRNKVSAAMTSTEGQKRRQFSPLSTVWWRACTSRFC